MTSRKAYPIFICQAVSQTQLYSSIGLSKPLGIWKLNTYQFWNGKDHSKTSFMETHGKKKKSLTITLTKLSETAMRSPCVLPGWHFLPMWVFPLLFRARSRGAFLWCFLITVSLHQSRPVLNLIAQVLNLYNKFFMYETLLPTLGTQNKMLSFILVEKVSTCILFQALVKF